MKKQETIEEMEKRDATGYARIPSQAAEFEEWESEQVWSDYEEGEPEEAIQQTGTTGGGTKAMEKALEQAAEIRHKLERTGRPFVRGSSMDRLKHLKSGDKKSSTPWKGGELNTSTRNNTSKP